MFKFHQREFKRSCSIFTYKAQEKRLTPGADNYTTTFGYDFNSPELTLIYDEYIIFDPVTLVGNIGGTLGIYVGFSIAGTINIIFEFARSMILNKDKDEDKGAVWFRVLKLIGGLGGKKTEFD